MTDSTATQLQMRSLIRASGEFELSLASALIPEPGPNEVLIRVQAAPLNPSDLGLVFGAADMSTARATGTSGRPVVSATVPAKFMRAMAGRVDQPMVPGNEGAGVVVKAGSSPEAQALVGRTVAALGMEMYSQYRCVNVRQCLPLPAGTTPAQGASCFVNPLTALGMVETMRMEGHSALVHTAAASNLGQMLNRICLKDGVPLVNVVRKPEQATLLREQGAVHVCDTSAPTFVEDLTKALTETGATIAFDAIGGGRLAGQILTSMEIAAVARMKEYSRYGSTTYKQVYIYGALDLAPTEIARNFGMAWGVGGWLLMPFLQKVGAEGAQRLRQRVVDELHTTFASRYTKTVSLAQALDLAEIAVYNKRATGTKYLIDPSLA